MIRTDRIETPSREHVTAIMESRGLERSEVLLGIGVAVSLLEGVIEAYPGIPGAVTRLAAAAMADWADSRADLPPRAA